VDIKDRMPLVADLLMDAAFADQRLEGEELSILALVSGTPPGA